MQQTKQPEQRGGSHAVAVISDVNLPAPARERGLDPQQWNALKSALFPNASDHMILLALDYCKARGLDPMKKPVHIVKTWDSVQRREVETIWEGIASHRITAARTGAYAGQDEPEFGPAVERQLGEIKCQFPEWCKVTVHRIVAGKARAFTGKVWWLEAYARKAKGDPNAMWRKRPWGQLAKCAEAEALRKAFPEEIGAHETADEMEGQMIDVTPARRTSEAVETSAVAVSRLDALEQAVTDVPETEPDALQEMLDDLSGDRPPEEPASEPDPAPAPAAPTPMPLAAQAREAAGRGITFYTTFWNGLEMAQRRELALDGTHEECKALAQDIDRSPPEQAAG